MGSNSQEVDHEETDFDWRCFAHRFWCDILSNDVDQKPGKKITFRLKKEPGMKKALILLSIIFLFFLSNVAHAFHIKIIVHNVECTEDGKTFIQFSLINERDINFNNTSLCFKLTSEGKPVACKELKVTVPAKADESIEYETTIETPCEGKGYDLKSTVFQNASRYRIEEWFEGCPESWKSDGNDLLKEKTDN